MNSIIVLLSRLSASFVLLAVLQTHHLDGATTSSFILVWLASLVVAAHFALHSSQATTGLPHSLESSLIHYSFSRKFALVLPAARLARASSSRNEFDERAASARGHRAIAPKRARRRPSEQHICSPNRCVCSRVLSPSLPLSLSLYRVRSFASSPHHSRSAHSSRSELARARSFSNLTPLALCAGSTARTLLCKCVHGAPRVVVVIVVVGALLFHFPRALESARGSVRRARAHEPRGASWLPPGSACTRRSLALAETRARAKRLVPPRRLPETSRRTGRQTHTG